MYAQGVGVEQDNATALEYFRRGAAKDHAVSPVSADSAASGGGPSPGARPALLPLLVGGHHQGLEPACGAGPVRDLDRDLGRPSAARDAGPGGGRRARGHRTLAVP